MSRLNRFSRIFGQGDREKIEAAEETAAEPDIPDTHSDSSSSDAKDIAEKLASVADGNWDPVQRDQRDRILGLYKLAPGPLYPGLRFMMERTSSDMLIWKIDLGDEELAGRGIGSLLLARAAQFALEEVNPNLQTVSRHQGTHAFAFAMSKTFGKENVRWNPPENLPPEEDIVCNIKATIDPERIKAIDIANKLGELASSARV